MKFFRDEIHSIGGNCSVAVRPSGTKPKIKVYISVSAGSKAKAVPNEEKIVAALEKILKQN